MLISSTLFMPMSQMNIVPSGQIPRQPVGVAEPVGVDLAERLRIVVGRELVGGRNRVVAQALHPLAHRRAARIDAQDGADNRVEALRLTGIVGLRAAAVAEPEIAAARIEQPVVGRAGPGGGIELEVAVRVRQVLDDVGDAQQLAARARKRRGRRIGACHSVITLW
jgi:hypothetical protein